MTTKLDFREIKEKETQKTSFPTDVFYEYRVHIAREAYERMMAHAQITTEVELCGVLVGQICRDERGPFLSINAVIEGENANNYGAQVTFTQQTWSHINAVKDSQYPKARIVGWYHTHPGFGVFLSGMDGFIQENFFNMPYQVAIVIETKQNKIGCFAWKDGKSTPLSRMWVGKEEKALAGGIAEEFQIRQADGVVDRGNAQSANPIFPEEPLIWNRYIFNLLVGGVFFLLGLYMGKNTAYGDLQRAGVASLENEMYSLLEFAGTTQSAAQDMAQSRESVDDVLRKIEKGDLEAARADLSQLRTNLMQMEKTFNKPRSEYRQQLSKTAAAKRMLAQRLDAMKEQQQETNLILANIMVMRIADMLKDKDKDKTSVKDFTAEELNYLRANIEMVVRLAPEYKRLVQEQFRDLFEILYPSKNDSERAKAP
jgi:proteasome lid subunit RPN8/RPN11